MWFKVNIFSVPTKSLHPRIPYTPFTSSTFPSNSALVSSQTILCAFFPLARSMNGGYLHPN